MIFMIRHKSYTCTSVTLDISLNYVMPRETFERSDLIRQFQTVQDVENSDLLPDAIHSTIGVAKTFLRRTTVKSIHVYV